MADGLACGHDVDQERTEQCEHGGHGKRKRKTPTHDQPGRAGEAEAVARAIGAAAQLLGGVGEAVEEEGAHQQEVVQHRIGGKRKVA